MKSIAFGLSICFATGIAFGKTQLQQDRETFKDLFISIADSGGADLLICGMKTERDQLINTTRFILDGYSKLNKNFPQADPPIEVQIKERNEYMYSLINRGNNDRASYCEAQKKFSIPYLIDRFQKTEQSVRDRLKKAGHDPELLAQRKISSDSSSSSGCPLRSKYYQDEFQRSGSTDDLVCAKKALERELR